jgi:hypothetical protein
MPILFHDFETYSTLDLEGDEGVGAWRYSLDPTTGVWCCSYAVDDGPVELWWPGDPVPAAFVEAERNSEWTTSAFADQFEHLITRHIMLPRYGWPVVPIERRHCSQAAALTLALPAKLGEVAAALDLPERKDKAGRDNMLLMAKPRKPWPDEDPSQIYWHDDPEHLEKLGPYCRQDTVVEREIHKIVGVLSPKEHAIWVLNATINDRGMYQDGALVDGAIDLTQRIHEAVNPELAAITSGAVTNFEQKKRIKAWLYAHGCEVANLAKETLHQALKSTTLAPEARRIIELRLEGAHAAAAKFVAMRNWRNPDGRIRGAFRYHGASTGRWTSLGVQVHNLKRPVTTNLAAAIEAVTTGNLDRLSALSPQPLSLIGDVSRAAIHAAAGHRFISGDLSGIESRGLAWAAGEISKLEQWAKFDRTQDPKDEPYYLNGINCGFGPDQARDIGKGTDLAFGYQGTVGAWRKLRPNDPASDEEIRRRHQVWVEAHPNTYRFWNDIDRAAISAIRNPGEVIACQRIAFDFDGTFLRMHLPSGRKLAYPYARLEMNDRGKSVVVFKEQKGKKWVDYRSGRGAYGGTWTENAIQAIARDLFAAAMLRLEAAGYRIVLHVHDEIVAEMPKDIGDIEEFRRIFIELPDWADGLPVGAKVRESTRFCKIPPPGAVAEMDADDDNDEIELADAVDICTPTEVAPTAPVEIASPVDTAVVVDAAAPAEIAAAEEPAEEPPAPPPPPPLARPRRVATPDIRIRVARDVELTTFTKTGGPLTKCISLAANGTLASDGSSCLMPRGSAERAPISGVEGLAALMGSLESHQALALGQLRADLPNSVRVTTKLALNGAAAPPGVITRTADNILYSKGQAAFALIDFDRKGLPARLAAQLKQADDFWQALLSVLPALATVARVTRLSTSAGLIRTDTGEALPPSGGLHVYVAVKDGADIERFLKDFHARCWLAGFGWMLVGAAGQLLERALVDRVIGGPERLVFEGPPILRPPLIQDPESRRPIVTDGGELDTLSACPPLSVVEQAEYRRLCAVAAHHLAGARAAARQAAIDQLMAQQPNLSPHQARDIIDRKLHGVLLPDAVLPFDDESLAGITVADVLADPTRFVGATLADPLEGVPYGRNKAMIMLRADGTPWIHSFAHGRTIYRLRYDEQAIRTAMDRVADAEAIDTLVHLVGNADLDPAAEERLIAYAHQRSNQGVRVVARSLKAARNAQQEKQTAAERTRRIAERRDPRPQFPVPAIDAEWLPIMRILNDVLSKSTAREPPMRDIDGHLVYKRMRAVPDMHALCSAATNANNEDEDSTQLPAPPQLLLVRMTEAECGELIERHIEFINEDSEGRIRPVHLPMPFIRHFIQRHDDLPVVTAISTLPLVLPDGTLLTKQGLDRDRGILFDIPEALLRSLPCPDECDSAAIKAAIVFLRDTWLADVGTCEKGKTNERYSLIAAALTLIERSLLPDRPTFFVSAGKRGGGKTTTLGMLITAATGERPVAATWSPFPEERRKALMSYLLEGVAYILWDNIPRGSLLSCPHIEKACTSAFYADRKLGVTETVAAAAAAIHLFTGNNIGPRGDLASRSLQIRLFIDSPDPENRTFTHPYPITWTQDNRAKILQCLYTILLGNPQLKKPRGAAAKTRFKTWWRVIGSAVEHAAALVGDTLDFKELFISQEEEDDDTTGLVEALSILLSTVAKEDEANRPKKFSATDVARLLNADLDEEKSVRDPKATALRAFLFPDESHNFRATAEGVTKRLRRHLDEPVVMIINDEDPPKRMVCTLRASRDLHAKNVVYRVEEKRL